MDHETISTREASPADTDIIHDLAHQIWWPTYQDFLSHDQIETMLARMYSVESLQSQMQEGTRFLLLYRDQEAIGFAGTRTLPSEWGSQNRLIRIEKLYILPSAQGIGGGARLLHEIYKQAESGLIHLIELNVNRNNPAIGFYLRQGFTIYKEADLPYERFVLNDYIMRKSLQKTS